MLDVRPGQKSARGEMKRKKQKINKIYCDEKYYLEICRKYSAGVFTASGNSAEEGFAALEKKGYSANPAGLMRSVPARQLAVMLGVMARWMPRIEKGRKQSYGAVHDYLEELENHGFIDKTHKLDENYPNSDIWKDIQQYAWDRWGCRLGFTHVPKELVYRNKSILFEYAIVAIMEMRKEKIDNAPGMEAGDEAQRVYAVLGEAVNDIAHYLRRKYGIKCQSHHPLAGMVNDCALAVKAGLGWQGRNGLLITPEFGQRVRIASVLIQGKYFPYTDSCNYAAGYGFCQSCGLCIKACPAHAIYPEMKEDIPLVEGIGSTHTCIDRYLCYRQFEKTLGCSICMKVCPFSQAQRWEKIKQNITSKKGSKNE